MVAGVVTLLSGNEGLNYRVTRVFGGQKLLLGGI
jgi:hypothetical protein